MDPAQALSSDRLSALPDDLLRRIMSFLNARHTVQMCLLSRRWCYLWRSLPRINAEFTEFYYEDAARFKKFINTLLLRRDPVPLDMFWLRYEQSNGNDLQEGSEEAGLWISHALQLQASVVEVVTLEAPLVLDHSVFTSRSLRRLRLSTANIPEGFFEQLKTGCPNLEDLLLYDCLILDDEISSNSLKILNINDSRFCEDYDASISIPSLTSLTLYRPGARVPLLSTKIPSLVSASVILAGSDGAMKFDHFCQLLMNLSDVRNLDLDYDPEKIEIKDNMQWCPEFKKLVNLTLGPWCLDSNFYALTGFLQNSPNLEKLTLEPEGIIDELEERSFKCEHLKIVEVICSKRSPLLKRVNDFFVNSGMSSLQINRKGSNEIEYCPDYFRFEYRAHMWK
uniref:F-box domain-containing protein n=1 Tax=Leersia perrieri TaxID=77586 RepID=A0A0D9XHH3_9ORYZ